MQDRARRSQSSPLRRLAVVLLLLCAWPAAAITITGPTPANHDLSDPITQLPAGASGTVTIDPILQLLPAGAGSLLFTRFQAEAGSQFPGWTIVSGDSLAGTLSISFYNARDCGTEGCTVASPGGGAGIQAVFTPGATDPTPAALRWIQIYSDNTGPGGSIVTHVDPFPNDDPAGDKRPWYLTETQHGQYSTATTMTFEDLPADHVGAVPFDRSVEFEVYLASFDGTQAIIHDGFRWGYDVVVTPEPGTLLALGLGLVLLGQYARFASSRP